MAQQAGDPARAGLAALTIVEELSGPLSSAQLGEYYKNAESLLAQSQHAGIHARLGESARRILAAEDPSGHHPSVSHLLAAGGPAPVSSEMTMTENGRAPSPAAAPDSVNSWTGCSLVQEVLRFEGDLIKRALEASGGSVTRAARMLGLTHQGLAFILNGRHKSLLSVRTPVRSRRRSIFRRH